MYSMERSFPLDFVAHTLAVRVGGQTGTRAPGWHVSSLIRASEELAKANTINPQDYWEGDSEVEREDQFDKATLGMMNMGRLWEEAIRPAFKLWAGREHGLFTQGPEQRELDGVVANCDGLVVEPGTDLIVAVMEAKFRFTDKTEPSKQERWMKQTKAYCRIWNTDSVWFVVGNVRQKPPSAGSRVYQVTFSQNEINENWALLMNTKSYLERSQLASQIMGELEAREKAEVSEWEKTGGAPPPLDPEPLAEPRMVVPPPPTGGNLFNTFAKDAEEDVTSFSPPLPDTAYCIAGGGDAVCQETDGCISIDDGEGCGISVCARTHQPTLRLLDNPIIAEEVLAPSDGTAPNHYHVFLPIPPDDVPTMCYYAAMFYDDTVHPVRKAEVRCDCGMHICRPCMIEVAAGNDPEAQVQTATPATD